MTRKNRVYIDFHVIQTVPPSCVNRDDTGSPKTALYGGVRRARVSSQSWKRAMREVFRDNFAEADLGLRTKRIVELVAEEIIALNPGKTKDDAMVLAEKTINLAGVSTKKGESKKGKTENSEAKALFFIARQQAKNLAELALGNIEDKKTLQKALNQNHSVEIALFGRMVADDPSLNVDASAQVAHSISTHSVSNEYDYFTAIDDLKSSEESAGAGMIGTVEFNSATLYRYATLAVHELHLQLAGDANALSKAVSEFARAFIIAMPTGKQNTFANRTLPDAVMVNLRADQPINLAGAFEVPVKPSREEGYKNASVKALREYAKEVCGNFAGEPVATYVIGTGLDGVGEKVNLEGLLDALARETTALLKEN